MTVTLQMDAVIRVVCGIVAGVSLGALWEGAKDTEDDVLRRFIAGLMISAVVFGCGWYAVTGRLPR